MEGRGGILLYKVIDEVDIVYKVKTAIVLLSTLELCIREL